MKLLRDSDGTMLYDAVHQEEHAELYGSMLAAMRLWERGARLTVTGNPLPIGSVWASEGATYKSIEVLEVLAR